MNIIRSSNSPWSSPLHMVAKPSSGWRACGDYRALNAVSEDDRYPMHHLQDFAINLEGKNIFSKIDLVRAYNQVPMNAADIAKTAIVTPFGLFEYLRMPFGLKNAAQTFQRFMDSVFRDLPFVYIYLDDILVASNSPDEHRKHLRQLFERLADLWPCGESYEMCVGQVEFRISRPLRSVVGSTSASGKSTAHHRLSATTIHQVTEGIP